MVDFYTGAYFAGMWRHEDPQDPIYDRSRTGFVVTFNNFPVVGVKTTDKDFSFYTTL